MDTSAPIERRAVYETPTILRYFSGFFFLGIRRVLLSIPLLPHPRDVLRRLHARDSSKLGFSGFGILIRDHSLPGPDPPLPRSPNLVLSSGTTLWDLHRMANHVPYHPPRFPGINIVKGIPSVGLRRCRQSDIGCAAYQSRPQIHCQRTPPGFSFSYL